MKGGGKAQVLGAGAKKNSQAAPPGTGGSAQRAAARRVTTSRPLHLRGSGPALSGSGRGTPWGQKPRGRFVQICTSRTSPIAPLHTYSTAVRPSFEECPWLPICVATLDSFARRESLRASSTDQQTRF